MVLRDQLACHRSRLAVANDPAVNPDHGHDLGSAPGQEAFIGVEQLVAGQVWLGDLDARQIRGAIVKMAREPFPPTVGALREAVLAMTGAADGTAAPDVDVAWAEVS